MGVVYILFSVNLFVNEFLMVYIHHKDCTKMAKFLRQMFRIRNPSILGCEGFDETYLLSWMVVKVNVYIYVSMYILSKNLIIESPIYFFSEKNIKKRKLVVLFYFNGELSILKEAIKLCQ